jgi:hypothetical protein
MPADVSRFWEDTLSTDNVPPLPKKREERFSTLPQGASVRTHFFIFEFDGKKPNKTGPLGIWSPHNHGYSLVS